MKRLVLQNNLEAKKTIWRCQILNVLEVAKSRLRNLGNSELKTRLTRREKKIKRQYKGEDKDMKKGSRQYNL